MILPIFDAHTRVQSLQTRIVPSNGWVDLSFICDRFSRVDVISFCKRATPLFSAVFQGLLGLENNGGACCTVQGSKFVDGTA